VTAAQPSPPASLADLQRIVDEWIRRHGRYWAPLSQYARLAEEVGELGRELNFRYGDKLPASKDAGGDVADELGDVLFVTILLANDLKVDLHATLLATLEKYDARRH
jgi:NTP pyrophosphatase (non-canonical NTP hydrolase)